mmetsp:Transcript_16791/g.54662  ORF Transcript_16791/g.54662 Transcript_16791/m.54662 type:complete len:265 (+) Transcript_16791:1364-2158(+)
MLARQAAGVREGRRRRQHGLHFGPLARLRLAKAHGLVARPCADQPARRHALGLHLPRAHAAAVRAAHAARPRGAVDRQRARRQSAVPRQRQLRGPLVGAGQRVRQLAAVHARRHARQAGHLCVGVGLDPDSGRDRGGDWQPEPGDGRARPKVDSPLHRLHLGGQLGELLQVHRRVPPGFGAVCAVGGQRGEPGPGDVRAQRAQGLRRRLAAGSGRRRALPTHGHLQLLARLPGQRPPADRPAGALLLCRPRLRLSRARAGGGHQ